MILTLKQCKPCYCALWQQIGVIPLSVVIIIHPYFWENNIVIDFTIFFEHTVAVLTTGNQICPQSYRNRDRYSYGYKLSIGIGISVDIGISIGIDTLLLLYLLSPMLSLSDVVQTSENNPDPFKVKINGVRDSLQLLNPKGDFEFQIACKWQLALLQGLYGISSLLPLSTC